LEHRRHRQCAGALGQHALYRRAFNVVGTPTGGGVPLDARTGAPVRHFPRVCGIVHVAIPDGAGGWFIGGYFSSIENEVRANIAHVMANGELADWAPNVWGESRYAPYEPIHPAIHALMLRGSRLYIGGRFSSVNGVSRSNVAVLDARTGALLPWDPGADGEVRCFEAEGGRLYVGGEFNVMGDSARSHLAAFDERSGRLEPWHPVADGFVLVMVIAGPRLYVGGQFDHVNGVGRNSVAVLDARTGAVMSWDAALQPHRSYIAHGSWIWPYVECLAIQGNTVYLGGWFTSAGGKQRSSFAALDARSALATDFDARLGNTSPGPLVLVNCVAVRGHAVCVGGEFDLAGGRARANLAELDARTGDSTPWNPRAAGGAHGGKGGAPWDPRGEGIVLTLAPSRDHVYTGGIFTNMYDWQPRAGLAALDLTTGHVTPFAPEVGGDGYVTSLGVIGNVLYAVGTFGQMGGASRWNIAALDATTGALLPWYPGPLGQVGIWCGNPTLTVGANTVYVGGCFYGIGGAGNNYMAALDPATAQPTPWNAYPDGGPYVMMATDHAVYIGGGFRHIGGLEHRYLAAVDPVTATALPWDPQPSVAENPYLALVVFALAKGGDVVYAGGRFTDMGGVPRQDLAAVDATTGALLPWAPNPDDIVEALAVGRSAIWAGGRFANIGGAPRAYLAALDPATGAPTPCDARANGEVLALAASGDTVFVGGTFQNLQGLPRGGVAVILPARCVKGRAAPVAEAPESNPLAFTWSAANPIRSTGLVRFTLPAAAPVSVRVFDLQGRRVASLLDRAAQTAGAHELTFSTREWRPGVYLCRFESGTIAATRKLIVVK
jgi:hypothetical protein